MKVRTRFAPSPTGYMHVGNLRTALYAYLLAKANGGAFILRIEDTDQERYVEGADGQLSTTRMRETGLLWDEGPDVGGGYGPYIQSERRGMYKGYAEQLVREREGVLLLLQRGSGWTSVPRRVRGNKRYHRNTTGTACPCPKRKYAGQAGRRASRMSSGRTDARVRASRPLTTRCSARLRLKTARWTIWCY